MNILDIILNKYPEIQGVSYWETQYDGTPWNHPYEGLVWENKEISKPTKTQLNTWSKEAAVIQSYTEKTNIIDNAAILKQLIEIDKKSIRALRAGEPERLEALEQQAIELRTQLKR